MKKRKLSLKKLNLKKHTITRLNNIKGGEEPSTEYPVCAISGCWGGQTCFWDTNNWVDHR